MYEDPPSARRHCVCVTRVVVMGARPRRTQIFPRLPFCEPPVGVCKAGRQGGGTGPTDTGREDEFRDQGE